MFPSTGGVKGPTAVSLVADDDWPAGIAASSLMAPPIRAPVLLSGADEVPSFTADALRGLAPSGSGDTDGKQAFVVGEAAAPQELEAQRLSGSSAAAVAEAHRQASPAPDRRRSRALRAGQLGEAGIRDARRRMGGALGRPGPVRADEASAEATLAAIRRHPDAPVYVLGPPSVISEAALAPVRKVAASVERISGDDPVQNAIAFARFAGGDFGWDINDPGHGFVIANTDRPLDAAAAAPLSASGTWDRSCSPTTQRTCRRHCARTCST